MIIADKRLANDPEVSVIICCYNQEDTIGQAIESIVDQDYAGPFELIVGDDASTDNTPAICRSYQEKYPDKIKLLLHEKNLGVSKNFKAVVEATRGRFVSLCGGDDYWTHPGKLRMQRDFLETHPDHALIHTAYQILNTGSGAITDSPIPKDWSMEDANLLLTKGNFIGALTIMIRKEFLEAANAEGLFDRFIMEDYPLWLFATQSSKLGFLEVQTAVWRKNPESLSNSTCLVKNLRFELGIADIRNHFAVRDSRMAEMKTTLTHSYKSILHQAFIANDRKLATRSFYKLRPLGTSSWKDVLYGHPLLQPVGRVLRSLAKLR